MPPNSRRSEPAGNRPPRSRTTGAIALTVAVCECGAKAAARNDRPTPIQKQLETVLQLDAEASALALTLDKDARDLNAGRVGQPDLARLTPADIYPRRAFALSLFKASDDLLDLETRLDKAIADYTAALSLKPTLTEALYGRAIARQRKGDREAAESDHRAALAADPDIARKLGIQFKP